MPNPLRNVLPQLALVRKRETLLKKNARPLQGYGPHRQMVIVCLYTVCVATECLRLVRMGNLPHHTQWKWNSLHLQKGYQHSIYTQRIITRVFN